MAVSEVLDKVRSRGYWDVTIRPEPYIGNRVAYDALDDLLMRASVRLRGWPVPYIHPGEYERGDNWIGAEVDAGIVDLYEAWRFFESGQFNHLRAISADWDSGRGSTRVPAGFDSVIEVWEILYYLTEVFELAARLSLTSAGDARMTVSVRLSGLRDRALVMGYPHYEVAGFPVPPRSSVAELSNSATLERDQLVAKTRELAVEWARYFFIRFGWKPEMSVLARLQRKLEE